MLSAYDHAHGNAARECSCQAGPRHTTFQNTTDRPPGVMYSLFFASFSAARGSSFRYACERTTHAHTCSLHCCSFCGLMAYASTIATRRRHPGQNLDTLGSGTLAIDRSGSQADYWLHTSFGMHARSITIYLRPGLQARRHITTRDRFQRPRNDGYILSREDAHTRAQTVGTIVP